MSRRLALVVSRLLAMAALCGCAGTLSAQVLAPSRTMSSTQFGAANTPWTPGQVEVFATSAMFVSNAERATVYRVDDRKQLLNQINQGGLPPDPQQAGQIARQRIQALGPEFNRRIRASLQAVEKAMVYGIQRVPAVVFDGQRVVYGVTDVTQAIEIVRRGGGQAIAARFAPSGRSARPNEEAVR